MQQSPRPRRPRVHALVPAAMVAALSLALMPSPASALESLDDVACACADDVLGIGDYVSCFAHLSRRLVVNGTITRTERQEALREAHRVDLDVVADACTDGGVGDALTGWGVSARLDRAFYDDPAAAGAADTAQVTAQLWNSTDDDVFQTTTAIGSLRGCLYSVIIREASGNTVHREPTVCGGAIGQANLPSGTLWEETFSLALEHEDSVLGFADGTPLEAGFYEVEVRWNAMGPHREDEEAYPITRPRAIITLRVGDP